MDLETRQAINQIGARVDHFEISFRDEIKALRSELRIGLDEVRGGLDEVRGGLNEVRGGLNEVRGGLDEVRGELKVLRSDLALNWSRTQLLFEAVRDDIKKLSDAPAPPPRKRRR
jgi:predicted nuclease with TOPRIM domain